MNPNDILDIPLETKQKYFETFVIGLIGGIVIGALIGSSVAWISKVVCPEYFTLRFGWAMNSEKLGKELMLKGVKEGGAWGGVFASIYIIMLARITKFECDINFLLRQSRWFIPIAYAFWLLGGLTYLLINSLNPEYLDFISRRLSRIMNNDLRLRYVWVLGSIQGCTFGGLGAIVFRITRMKKAWKKEIGRRGMIED